MRERPGSGDRTSGGEGVTGRPRRIDLSVPQVAKRYRLDQLADAVRTVAEGKTAGRIVLSLDGGE